MNPLLPLFAAGAVGLFMLARKGGGGANTAAPGQAYPLHAGVGYLFIVRLGTDITDEEARSVLDAKHVESLVLGPAVNPPFWATTGAIVFSNRIASFKATPPGNSSVTLGEPFYGIGRLETLVRLDGQPFTAEASDV